MQGPIRTQKLSQRRIRTLFGRGVEGAVATLIEGVRLAILIAPIAFALPLPVRAGIVESIEYEEVEEQSPLPVVPSGLAHFGPFVVVSPDTAELYGETDSTSPDAFERMLAAYPQLKTLRLIECAGTIDDVANLALARLIKRAGLSTHVPANGSVRSGGVELFMGGVKRSYEHGAEFGVHSWEDDEGHEARDFGQNDPVRGDYVRFYTEAGLSPDRARDFYAFTNQTPFAQIHYLTDAELMRFGLTN